MSMTESEKLIALSVEAKDRGVTYGQLVASTTEAERKKIAEKYMRRRGKGKR